MVNEGFLNSKGIFDPTDFEKLKNSLPVNLAEKAIPLFTGCGEASSEQ
jgi:hypothetical protein